MSTSSIQDSTLGMEIEKKKLKVMKIKRNKHVEVVIAVLCDNLSFVAMLRTGGEES